MSELSYNESLIILLHNVSSQFNRYISIFIFIFGVVGNILNIFVLSRRSLRSNPCAWIFLVASIVNLISILSGLITIMIGGWVANPAGYIELLCKIRSFLVFTTRTIAPWLIALATIDRWLLSSIDAHRRQRSTLKNAQRWTIVIVILSILLYAQLFYCYEANRVNEPLECYGSTAACRYVTDLSFSLITILFPLFFMILFGLLTISNVRQSQRRIQALKLPNIKSPMNKLSESTNGNSEVKLKRKTDHSLLRMLLVQIFLITILTFPLSLQKFYSSFAKEIKTPVGMAINDFAYNLFVLLYFVSNGMPFYIYTLCGGVVFRKALYDFVLMVTGKIMHR
ncbi:unnamed protein product [Rotaria sp. Silwood2]|nr:unnamed protein product [Rotaria sp. Silwood2]CAF2838262.1 unnamed protein product [Rotaria sp. Silwood2]CAF3000763.1 unnamed protein product [Rotaria sp. Silwood2]CAF4085095.1 unnamed protein product [Rotaria sp. Silwood2]CAF4159705.1 unnamed protein product [Rotaria sp. Silwood2]